MALSLGTALRIFASVSMGRLVELGASAFCMTPDAPKNAPSEAAYHRLPADII
jgi:hypothetical protein